MDTSNNAGMQRVRFGRTEQGRTGLLWSIYEAAADGDYINGTKVASFVRREDAVAFCAADATLRDSIRMQERAEEATRTELREPLTEELRAFLTSPGHLGKTWTRGVVDEMFAQRERAEKAEALLRECRAFVQVAGSLPGNAQYAEDLLARLPKPAGE